MDIQPELARTPLSGRRRQVLRRSWHAFLEHHSYDAAAALTYFATLSVLPGALLGVSAFALLGNQDRAVDDLSAVVGSFAPDSESSVRGALGELLGLTSPGLAFAIGLVLTLWSVSGYATAFGRAINSVYEVQEGRMFWRFRGGMLVLAVGILLLGGAIAAVLLLTPSAAREIFGTRGVAPEAYAVWSIVRWPLLALLLVVLVGLLFYFAPNVRFTRLRWLSVGSALSIAIWAVLTAGFALYVVLIGAYGHVYGKLGLILVALLWFYLSNNALMLGAHLDAEIVRMRQLEAGMSAEDVVLLGMKRSDRNLQLARRRAEDVAESVRIRDEARARPSRRSAPDSSG